MLRQKKKSAAGRRHGDDGYRAGKNKGGVCSKQISFFYLIPTLIIGCLLGFAIMSYTYIPDHQAPPAIQPAEVAKELLVSDPEQQESVVKVQEPQPEINVKNEVSEIEKEKTSNEKKPAHAGADVEKMEAVKKATLTAYQDFERICHGKDELWPIGKKCHNWVNMGLTTIDTLDTLWLMGYKEEFHKAVDWIRTSLNITPPKTVSFFETVIRCLGGLLSAYAMSGDQVLLDKAKQLGQALYPAFNTATGLPMGQVNLRTGKAKNPGWSGGGSLLAEVGTVQLEFGYLSVLTGDKKFEDAAFKVFDLLDPQQGRISKLRFKGQYPIYISPHDLSFKTTHISWGAMGDSFYEYLLKLWIMTGKTNDQYKRMYVDSVEGMFEHLWIEADGGLGFIAEFKGNNVQRKMDHLACFASAMLVLGVHHNVVEGEAKKLHLERGEKLAESCYQMYHRMQSGLSPEYVTFDKSGNLHPGVDFYLLRPETVESFFLLWRVTKNQKWRDYGWEVFQQIQKHCRVEGAGYVPVLNVNNPKPRHDPNGKMQSFLLAETFKYLFLLFSDDDVINLDKFVFNTEAHPLPVRTG